MKIRFNVGFFLEMGKLEYPCVEKPLGAEYTKQTQPAYEASFEI